jgi:hypothetical protein
MRFEDGEVLTSINEVIKRIEEKIMEIECASPLPPPGGGYASA